MIIVPLVYSGYLSFFKKQLIGGSSFAGFDNYTRALTDPLFLSGVARMARLPGHPGARSCSPCRCSSPSRWTAG